MRTATLARWNASLLIQVRVAKRQIVLGRSDDALLSFVSPEVTFTHVLVSGGLQVEGAVTEVFDLEDARQDCPKPAEFLVSSC